MTPSPKSFKEAACNPYGVKNKYKPIHKYDLIYKYSPTDRHCPMGGKRVGGSTSIT